MGSTKDDAIIYPSQPKRLRTPACPLTSLGCKDKRGPSGMLQRFASTAFVAGTLLSALMPAVGLARDGHGGNSGGGRSSSAGRSSRGGGGQSFSGGSRNAAPRGGGIRNSGGQSFVSPRGSEG